MVQTFKTNFPLFLILLRTLLISRSCWAIRSFSISAWFLSAVDRDTRSDPVTEVAELARLALLFVWLRIESSRNDACEIEFRLALEAESEGGGSMAMGRVAPRLRLELWRNFRSTNSLSSESEDASSKNRPSCSLDFDIDTVDWEPEVGLKASLFAVCGRGVILVEVCGLGAVRSPRSVSRALLKDAVVLLVLVFGFIVLSCRDGEAVSSNVKLVLGSPNAMRSPCTTGAPSTGTTRSFK